jgi:hypothetical protein
VASLQSVALSYDAVGANHDQDTEIHDRGEKEHNNEPGQQAVDDSSWHLRAV